MNSNFATINMNGVGLKALGSSTTGRISIDSCTINGNSITMGAAVNNGIAAGLGAYLSAATVSVLNSTFQGNNASGSNGSSSFLVNGGGVRVITSNFSLMTTTVSSNVVMLSGAGDDGAGIYYTGSGVANIDGLTCIDNESSRSAGCLWYRPTSTAMSIITNSSFIGNIDHNSDGGGIYYRSSGAPLTITNSYFESGVSGTSLLVVASLATTNLTVKNSTFITSTSEGVYLRSSLAGTAVFENCTFIATGASVAFAKIGGATQTTTFKNSIFEKTGAGNACSGTMGISTLGYNLARDASCTFLSGGSGDLISTNPLLSAPASNGGATKTAAIAAGSPARDAVPLAACALTTDQRGTTRPQGGLCDIGAYEY